MTTYFIMPGRDGHLRLVAKSAEPQYIAQANTAAEAIDLAQGYRDGVQWAVNAALQGKITIA